MHKTSEIDGGYGWIVTFACFAVCFIMQGMSRAAGVLYVALIELYGVSRETATAPFSLRFGLRNLISPIVGILAQSYGMRSVVVAGGILASIGGALCAIAPDIFWITVLWGIVHGIGYGLSTSIHVLILNLYFDKYRATSLALALTGDCIGTFVFPNIFQFLLFKYGVDGTFLILGAICLNIIPAGLIMRTPKYSSDDKEKSHGEQLNCQEFSKAEYFGVENKSFEKDEVHALDLHIIVPRKDSVLSRIILVPPMSELKCELLLEVPFDNKHRHMRKYSMPSQFHQTEYQANQSLGILSKSSSLEQVNCSQLAKIKEKRTYETLWKEQLTSIHKNSNSDKSFNPMKNEYDIKRDEELDDQSTAKNDNKFFCNSSLISLPTTDDCMFNKEQIPNGGNRIVKCTESSLNPPVKINCIDYETEENKNKKSSTLKVLKNLLYLNIRPMFLLIVLNLTFYYLVLIAVITILVDYAADKNISPDISKYLIIGFSVTDLCGRLGFGVVLDKKWIKLSHFSCANMILMGISVFSIPFFSNYWYVMSCMLLFGLMQGGNALIYPLLLDDYLNKGEETVALGCMNFYGGLIMFPVAPMIGFFRDTIGNYDGVFYTVGGLCLLAGISWFLEPVILKLNKRMCKNALH